jgi:hypothetical protein
MANYSQISTLKTTPAIHRKGKKSWGEQRGVVSIRHLLRLPRGKRSGGWGARHLIEQKPESKNKRKELLIRGFPELLLFAWTSYNHSGIVHLGFHLSKPRLIRLSAIVRWALGMSTQLLLMMMMMMMFTFHQSDHIHVVPLLIVRHDMAPMSNKAFCKEL